VDECERYTIYFLEKMMGMGGGEKFVVVFDMHG